MLRNPLTQAPIYSIGTDTYKKNKETLVNVSIN